ncbi:MAG: hypothetical protein JRJ26_06990 [Deltaproteobacteria bacterium]|nr:hypothetical protein [Deltaproteobacteria bacterium]
MRRAAVLGAGYMGSSITFPLAENGIAVNLWGTWFDDDIIDSCRKGHHPRLKKRLPEDVNLYGSENLEAALRDVDAVWIAVSSGGFLPVFSRAVELISGETVFFALTKGLIPDNGRVKRQSEIAEELFEKEFPGKRFLWISIGGPVKAVELSDRIPSASVYGISDPELRRMAGLVSTDCYRVFCTTDVVGVELSASFKNVYAMAVGMCDGIYGGDRKGGYHNLSSLLFTQGVKEMSVIVARAGGKNDTAFGLAGVGDLYVTARSGRNRRCGEMIGRGIEPREAYAAMLKEGEIAEGYPALEQGVEWIRRLDPGLMNRLPLLECLHRIVFQGQDPADCLKGLTKILPLF